MALEIDKINVRSPYYINVVAAEPVELPTADPVSISCGGSQNIGQSVGVLTYDISAANRELGTYTISFSGLKVPVKYRLGVKGNLPSYTTSDGWDTYTEEWKNATGETNAFSSSSANPNGMSDTATYTSTQSDIDTYGNTLQLQILQPIPTEAYSFSLSCPAAETTTITDAAAIGLQTQFLTLHNDAITETATVKLNGETGVISLPAATGYTAFKTTHFNHRTGGNVYGIGISYPPYSSVAKAVISQDKIVVGTNRLEIEIGTIGDLIGGIARPANTTRRGTITLWWANHPLYQSNSQTFTYTNTERGLIATGGQVNRAEIPYVGDAIRITIDLYTARNPYGEGIITQGLVATSVGYQAGSEIFRQTVRPSNTTF